MKYFQYLAYLFLCVSFYMFSAQVVMVMGPSCAGKSTIAKKVCMRLSTTNAQWAVVDFDEVEENISKLIQVVNVKLARNINVIVDTNTYTQNMEQQFIGAECITKIVVRPSLAVLLARDAQRTKCLQRTQERAHRCKNFVIHSFKQSGTWLADVYIDSGIDDVNSCVQHIVDMLQQGE